MTPCEPNAAFSPEYFKQPDVKPVIDEQLSWLEQELMIASKQANQEVNKLQAQIRDLQRQELKTESQMQSPENSSLLSEHFAKTLVNLEMVQLAESVK